MQRKSNLQLREGPKTGAGGSMDGDQSGVTVNSGAEEDFRGSTIVKPCELL